MEPLLTDEEWCDAPTAEWPCPATEAKLEHDDVCPDCDGTGTTWIDRWSHSRDTHYTEDVPCVCTRDRWRDREDDRGDALRDMRKHDRE